MCTIDEVLACRERVAIVHQDQKRDAWEGGGVRHLGASALVGANLCGWRWWKWGSVTGDRGPETTKEGVIFFRPETNWRYKLPKSNSSNS